MNIVLDHSAISSVDQLASEMKELKKLVSHSLRLATETRLKTLIEHAQNIQNWSYHVRLCVLNI